MSTFLLTTSCSSPCKRRCERRRSPPLPLCPRSVRRWFVSWRCHPQSRTRRPVWCPPEGRGPDSLRSRGELCHRSKPPGRPLQSHWGRRSCEFRWIIVMRTTDLPAADANKHLLYFLVSCIFVDYNFFSFVRFIMPSLTSKNKKNIGKNIEFEMNHPKTLLILTHRSLHSLFFCNLSSRSALSLSLSSCSSLSLVVSRVARLMATALPSLKTVV